MLSFHCYLMVFNSDFRGKENWSIHTTFQRWAAIHTTTESMQPTQMKILDGLKANNDKIYL